MLLGLFREREGGRRGREWENGGERKKEREGERFFFQHLKLSHD